MIIKSIVKYFAARKAAKREAETRALVQGLQEKLREKFAHLRNVEYFAASESHPADAQRIGYLRHEYFAEALRVMHLVNELQ